MADNLRAFAVHRTKTPMVRREVTAIRSPNTFQTTSHSISSQQRPTSHAVSCERKIALKNKEVEEEIFNSVWAERQRLNKHQSNRQNAFIEIQKFAEIDPMPMEFITQKDSTDVEGFCYLLEDIIPTVTLGLQHLLDQAESRNVSQKISRDPNFNPINYLARYLLHCNPSYNNLNENLPYTCGIREVSKSFRRELFLKTDSELLQAKVNYYKQRVEEERAAARHKLEQERRARVLLENYSCWRVGPTGLVESLLVKNSLVSFKDLISQYPDSLQEPVFLEEALSLIETEYLDAPSYVKVGQKFAELLSETVFHGFVEHLRVCAATYCRVALQQLRKAKLVTVFHYCDRAQVGVLDRVRLFRILAKFYDQLSDLDKKVARNPAIWPMRDPTEMGDNATYVLVVPEEVPAVAELPSAQAPAPPDMDETGEDLLEDVLGQAKEQQAEDPNERANETSAERDAAMEDGANVAAAPGEGVEAGKIVEGVEGVEGAKEATGATGVAEMTGVAGVTGVMGAATSNGTAEVGAPQSASAAKADTVEQQNGASVEQLHRSSASVDGRPRTILSRILEQREQLNSASVGSRQEISIPLRSPTSTATSVRSYVSAFEEQTLNLARFIQLVENFLSMDCSEKTFDDFCADVQQNYSETEDEKLERLQKAHREALLTERRELSLRLFEQWDNECQGWLDMDEVMTLLIKYKYGHEKEAMEAARDEFLRTHTHGRMTKKEFFMFLKSVAERLPGDAVFENLVDFMSATLEKTIGHQEKMRGELRRKWLSSIAAAAEQSGVVVEPVYRALFQVIVKDAETHGQGKRISAYVGMLERTDEMCDDGKAKYCLRYVASTADCARFLLNQRLRSDEPSVTFGVIESGKLLHIPKCKAHGNVRFWHPAAAQRDGSLVLIPLKDELKRVFGVIGIDTVNDLKEKHLFVTHEIKFYQGLAKVFSQSFQYVDVRRKILLIAQSASTWIIRRCPSISNITLFIGEPLPEGGDYVLRKVMKLDKGANLERPAHPPRLERKDNIFRDYLFKCMDTSETVVADAYGERHLAYPLRDNSGVSVASADLCLGTSKQLQAFERREIQKTLLLLQRAMRELYDEAAGQSHSAVLQLEKNDDVRVEILLDRLMLQDLRESVLRLAEEQGLAELRSYSRPPDVVHAVVKTVLLIFQPERVADGHFDDWANCKKHLKFELLQRISKLDPTSLDIDNFPFSGIDQLIKNLEPDTVARQGSTPGQYLYNWAFVSLSLIDRVIRIRDRLRSQKPIVVPNEVQHAAAAPDASAPPDGAAAASIQAEAAAVETAERDRDRDRDRDRERDPAAQQFSSASASASASVSASES